MAQNFAFLSYGATTLATVTGNGGINTATIGTNQTGLPATSVRIWNQGTQVAFIMMGTGVTLTTTGGLANGMPVPQSIAPFVLRTGGVSTIQFGSLTTFTTTLSLTAGEGID